MATPSSDYCRNKIKEYTNARSDLSNALAPISNSENAVNLTRNYTDKLILLGEPFGEDEMDGFKSSLSTIRGNFDTMISECDDKIAEWEAKLQIAIQQELAEAEAEAKANGTWARGTFEGYNQR